MPEPSASLGGLVTFLTTKLGTGYEVLLEFPEQEPDVTKKLVIVELQGHEKTQWIGQDAPEHDGKKTRQHAFAIRLEAWTRTAKDAADVVSAVEEACEQDFAGLLVASGMKLTTFTAGKAVPFEDGFPGWQRATTVLNALKDETWGP